MKLAQVEHCKNIWQKAIGIMFRWKIDKPLVFYFEYEHIIPLHMFFCLFPIDVIFLDSKKRVVEKATLRPWQVYIPKKKAKYVIEMEAGSAKVKIREKVEF